MKLSIGSFQIGTTILLLLTIICPSESLLHVNPFEESFENPKQEIFLFDQIVDHSEYYSQSTWKQRYFVFDQYFNPSTGPVILYICGQGECRGVSNTSFTAQIAQETNGLVLALEHRFYGKSLPFGQKTFELQNLKYLSAEQALNDLAYFISQIKKNKLHRVSSESKWLTVGGSYPGALSAWFRAQFPHLTVGAIASSGVILAVENFRDFDTQIYTSAMKSGQECVDAIRKVTQYAEDQVLSDNRIKFQSIFGAENLSSREFLFYWSDVIVFFVQYGKRSSFCKSISNKTLEEVFNVVKEAALKQKASDYGAYYLSDANFTYQTASNARPWIYQSCTEFSYFQTFSLQHPMRSKMLTIDFYRTWCQNIFGPDIWPPISRVNNALGGLKIKATNLIMTNGNQGMFIFDCLDPWKWASLQKSENRNITAKVIDCDDCAHCIDLHGSQATDAKDLTATRALQMSLVKIWLGLGKDKKK